MVIKTIPALKARTHFGEIMQRSFKKKERFLVEKSGIPMVVIINAKEYEEYARIMEEREERFKIIDVIRNRVPEVAPNEIEKDIDETIQTVRKQNGA